MLIFWNKNYRSGVVNSNTVNLKFHLIRSYYEISFYHFPNIPCLKCTVKSNFHLIRSKTLLTNVFKLTVPDLYFIHGTLHVLLTRMAKLTVRFGCITWQKWCVCQISRTLKTVSETLWKNNKKCQTSLHKLNLSLYRLIVNSDQVEFLMDQLLA